MNTIKKPYKKVEETPIWSIAHGLTLDIYLISKKFPREEQFGLIAQIRRAISSVPANITEGFYRGSNKELMQFLLIARGSLGESFYHLRLSKDLNYISEKEFKTLELKYSEVGRQLNNWISSIKRRVSK